MDKQRILENAKIWFAENFAQSHIANTEKLVNPREFAINPFTAVYLAHFLTGNSSPASIAKVLLYPRVLGTSVTTIFGMGMQRFTNDVLGTFGSSTSGIDIEFIDQIDGYKKYCQLKSGPNTLNKDDVETINGHFTAILRLARTNNLRLSAEDLIVGVIYGEPSQLSSHYHRVTSQYHYPVRVGRDFWHRLTGDETFYDDLLETIGSVAIESNFSAQFAEILEKLASHEDIIKISNPE